MNFEALVKHISTIQNTLQAQAAHAVNLALTSRNWLMGCYIVEFEQNGEDRAAYGEQLLKKLEQRLKTKGLNERRFREFRRLYLVYPQLKGPVTQYIASQIQIRQSLTAEFTEPIRRLATAESENGVWKLSIEPPQTETWMIPADNPPIGILLCTEKGDTLVKYATAGLDPNIFVQKYMIELPTEDEIKEFISSSSY
ncbi:PDDEXK nuclease domain-containing protein [Parabacteroides sp.]